MYFSVISRGARTFASFGLWCIQKNLKDIYDKDSEGFVEIQTKLHLKVSWWLLYTCFWSIVFDQPKFIHPFPYLGTFDLIPIAHYCNWYCYDHLFTCIYEQPNENYKKVYLLTCLLFLPYWVKSMYIFMKLYSWSSSYILPINFEM